MALKQCSECGHGMSSKAAACPSCGAPNKAKTCCLAWVILIIFIFFFISAIGSCLYSGGGSAGNAPTTANYNTSNSSWDASTLSQIQGAEIYKYTIMKIEDTSYLGNARCVIRVKLLTDDVPSEQLMKLTANKIWKAQASKWQQVTVFMIFGEIENFNSGAYGIAEFNKAGLTSFEVNKAPLKILKLKKEGAFE